MAKAKRIEGFNAKEQLIFNRLRNGGRYSFRELKTLFTDEAVIMCKLKRLTGVRDVDIQAQSFARNSIRRLIRDGWVEQIGRGTYQLTKTGQKRVAKGIVTTPSADGRRETKPRTVKKTRGRPIGTTKKAAVKVAKKKIVAAKAKTLRAAIDKDTKKTAKPNIDKVKALRTKIEKEATQESKPAKKSSTSKDNNKSKTKKALALMARVVAEKARTADTDAAE
jgi:hypothetical protein